MRDMCGCHNHGNKDKGGSSLTMTSHKLLVMHNPSLLNAHHNIHSHMVAWRLRDSMTTLCLTSHCAFVANRHIRNNIVLVNSLIDANTDGVIMMLDWAKAYDSVDQEHLENVLFCMGCDGIGLQRLMSTAKGFTLRVIGNALKEGIIGEH